MPLTSTLIPNTPLTLLSLRPQGVTQVHLVNDDPSQTIDVTVYRSFDDATDAAKLSEEQFTAIAPGEARVGAVAFFGNGVLLIFKAQASGAGNAPLRNWIASSP